VRGATQKCRRGVRVTPDAMVRVGRVGLLKGQRDGSPRVQIRPRERQSADALLAPESAGAPPCTVPISHRILPCRSWRRPDPSGRHGRCTRESLQNGDLITKVTLAE